MLRIRQYLDPLPINRTAKAVLTEVCELVENGHLGYCNAQNAHFVSRLAGSERTITRALAELARLGLVAINGQGKARCIAPTPKLRTYYTAPTAEARRAAADALNLAGNPANLDTEPSQNGEVYNGPNLAKNGCQPRQKWSDNLDKSGRQPSQKWSAPNKVYEQYEQITSTTKHALTARERTQFEKRIAVLERENARLQQLLAAKQPTASIGLIQSDPPPTSLSPEPATEPPAFEQFWNLYGKKVDAKKCRLTWQKLTNSQRQAALAHVPGYVRTTPDPQFRKNPLTYLHGECWQDDLLAVATAHPPTGAPLPPQRASTAPTSSAYPR